MGQFLESSKQKPELYLMTCWQNFKLYFSKKIVLRWLPGLPDSQCKHRTASGATEACARYFHQEAGSMKLFQVYAAAILVGLVTLQLVKACGPYQRPFYPDPHHPFNVTNTNGTKELGYIPISSAVRLGALRGLREIEKLFNGSRKVNWPFITKRVDPELPVFVNTTIPYATREAALIHAISAAAIAYELTLKCRHNIRGCKCVRPRYINIGCGDNFEFGRIQTYRFFGKLEKKRSARAMVNMHNVMVGVKVVETSQIHWCKCHGLATACKIRTCYSLLAPFEKITAELKKNYDQRDVQVEFRHRRLYKRIGDKFRRISWKDSTLVYLDHTPLFCVRNDSLGTPGMLGSSCRRNSTIEYKDCKIFSLICTEYCNLKSTTAVEMEEFDCNCKFQWYLKKCQKCTRPSLLTICVVNNDN